MTVLLRVTGKENLMPCQRLTVGDGHTHRAPNPLRDAAQPREGTPDQAVPRQAEQQILTLPDIFAVAQLGPKEMGDARANSWITLLDHVS